MQAYCLLSIQDFRKHTKLALMPTLYTHIFVIFYLIYIKQCQKMWNEISAGTRGLHFKVRVFIDLVNFLWHSQNEVGNNAIIVLWKVCEKLCSFPIDVFVLCFSGYECVTAILTLLYLNLTSSTIKCVRNSTAVARNSPSNLLWSANVLPCGSRYP